MALLRLLLLLSLCLPAWAAEPRANPSAADRARTLELDNRPIFLFLAKQASLSPEQRLQRTVERIQELDANDLKQPVKTAPLADPRLRGIALSINGKPLFTLLADDLDPGDQLTLEQAAARAQDRLNDLRQAALEQRSPEQMVKAGLLALLATAVFIALLSLIMRLRGASRLRLQQQPLGKLPWLGGRFDFHHFLRAAECQLVDITALLSALAAGYVWLSYALGLFPYTRPLGRKLGDSFWQLVATIVDDILSALPGLATVAVIFLLTRLLHRALALLFGAVERGQLDLPGLHAETVGATRRLAGVALWLFALIVAYPYLPGAGSDAFKGVSVFFGLMVTLGSAGLMNHAMSGLVLIYSRALRAGDYVRVGEVEGTVSELSALSTKIATCQGFEITIPNAVAVGGRIHNFSRHDGEDGALIATRLTIGYDTPWRQVAGLLELAARRCEGVDPQWTPRVRKLALQDFYIEYELQVKVAQGANPPDVLDALLGHALDAFNEFGVQILSPHFTEQPAAPAIVPQPRWREPPARQ
ncbi:mechanosensitive ion channel family protein [Chromobacterium sp. IIBBL 290-4]|uniref:mechanosensitive ion channel family protein n=1 Tax=Chromobacterium sp. IIBBL 290-4 TaxID=2953890 RepID=UPI0020B78248|nr:mechanosensitive ion channel domain-containing protein [Chromobacterium sp. IIBBL 290-4]UTH75511.1 mechanosensitive ion channel family protein [Chromobacterium sp. IIBBL 290-4]